MFDDYGNTGLNMNKTLKRSQVQKYFRTPNCEKWRLLFDAVFRITVNVVKQTRFACRFCFPMQIMRRYLGGLRSFNLRCLRASIRMTNCARKCFPGYRHMTCNLQAEKVYYNQGLAKRRKHCCGNKFRCSETKNVFVWGQKHFCFPDTNFASETYPEKHNQKHCFHNNVSQFSQSFRTESRLQAISRLHKEMGRVSSFNQSII